MPTHSRSYEKRCIVGATQTHQDLHCLARHSLAALDHLAGVLLKLGLRNRVIGFEERNRALSPKVAEHPQLHIMGTPDPRLFREGQMGARPQRRVEG